MKTCERTAVGNGEDLLNILLVVSFILIFKKKSCSVITSPLNLIDDDVEV